MHQLIQSLISPSRAFKILKIPTHPPPPPRKKLSSNARPTFFFLVKGKISDRDFMHQA